MKSMFKNWNNKLASAIAAAAMLPMIASAGTVSEKGSTMVTPPAEEEPFITGNLTVLYETHFISYGQDVWGIGNSWDEWFIHPSFELDFNLGGGWQFFVNTWWDVNDQGYTTIGDNIQEIDVNAGFYYTLDKWKFTVAYGAWMYGEQVEHIVDGKIAYNDGLINPFVLVHGRVADDIPLDTGVVAQVGIAPAYTLGPVALSFPIAVSFNTTDNFHGGDAGFAYVSAGIGASIPLYKTISLSLGATYYHTEDDVIPNPESDFVVGSAGIVVTF